MQLAAILLEKASEVFGRRGCNDFNVVEEAGMDNPKERKALALAIAEWGGDKDWLNELRDRPTSDTEFVYLYDWMAMDYLADRLKEGSEQMTMRRTAPDYIPGVGFVSSTGNSSIAEFFNELRKKTAENKKQQALRYRDMVATSLRNRMESEANAGANVINLDTFVANYDCPVEKDDVEHLVALIICEWERLGARLWTGAKPWRLAWEEDGIID